MRGYTLQIIKISLVLNENSSKNCILFYFHKHKNKEGLIFLYLF